MKIQINCRWGLYLAGQGIVGVKLHLVFELPTAGYFYGVLRDHPFNQLLMSRCYAREVEDLHLVGLAGSLDLVALVMYDDPVVRN